VTALRSLPAHVESRHLVVAAGGCVALAVVGLVDPSRHTVTPPCPLRLTTGLDCPLCGATRATHALLHGNVARALDFNALYVLALPIAAVLTLWWLRTGSLPEVARRRWVVWTAAGVAIAFAVARNLPPFTMLAS
jgi:hypothetical protein